MASDPEKSAAGTKRKRAAKPKKKKATTAKKSTAAKTKTKAKSESGSTPRASLSVESEPGSTAPKATLPDEEVVAAPAAHESMPPRIGGFLSRGRVRFQDVTTFLSQLIMLVEAGTPILKSLQTLSRRSKQAPVRELVSDLAQYVEAGNPLWQAFDRHPAYFDGVFVNLIKASEASGNLVPVLRRVVDYRSEVELMRKRVRGAMIYPALLVLACFVVMLVLTNIVVPEFQEMFEKADLEIPLETEYFLAVSNAVAVWWWTPIVAVFVLWFLYSFWYVRDPLRRLTADRMKLRIPVVGPILHKHSLAEFMRTMSLLLRSGLSMMATLDLTRSAIHNRAVAETLQSMRDSVERGAGLEPPMRDAEPVIPYVVTDMFVTGEDTGRVDQVAEQLAATYEAEVNIAVNSLGEMLQPIFTVVIGVAVMVLFIALFLPLVNMMEQLAGAGL